MLESTSLNRAFRYRCCALLDLKYTSFAGSPARAGCFLRKGRTNMVSDG